MRKGGVGSKRRFTGSDCREGRSGGRVSESTEDSIVTSTTESPVVPEGLTVQENLE